MHFPWAVFPLKSIGQLQCELEGRIFVVLILKQQVFPKKAWVLDWQESLYNPEVSHYEVCFISCGCPLPFLKPKGWGGGKGVEAHLWCHWNQWPNTLWFELPHQLIGVFSLCTRSHVTTTSIFFGISLLWGNKVYIATNWVCKKEWTNMLVYVKIIHLPFPSAVRSMCFARSTATWKTSTKTAIK